MTLVFRRSGNVEIKEVCSSPGSSAGNTFGGTFTYPLRSDFCETQTAEEIAGGLSMDARRAILEDGRLAAFMEKARTHAYYKGKN